jgi:hypothetical protein
MSDTAQGPGWWLASDGKWYPPEQWTGPPARGPAAQPAYPAQGPVAGQPPYGGAALPPSYAGYATNTPYGSYGLAPQKKTNGMAIAALVCGCAGLFFLPAILGIIFGFVARSQIRRSNGVQKGEGMALAGILVAIGWLALLVLSITLGHHNNNGTIDPALVMGHLGGLFP